MNRPAPARASFTVLLILLSIALMLAPMWPLGTAVRFWLELLVMLAMVSAVWKLRPGRVLFVLVVAAAAVTEAGSAARVWSPARSWIVIDHAGTIVFLLLVVWCITWGVWREREVSADTIVGGVAVYLLLGVAWSAAYQLLEFLSPGSLEVVSGFGGHWGAWEAAPGQFPRLFFFSFVTLTTLGYGDIVPASAPAAALTSAEAVVGPLYLTILIARLVGLHVAGARAGDRGGGGNPPTA